MSHSGPETLNYPTPNPFVPETIIPATGDCGCGCGGGSGCETKTSTQSLPVDCTLPQPVNQMYPPLEEHDDCCCCCCCEDEHKGMWKPRPEGGVAVESTGPGKSPPACLLGLRFSLDSSADESTVTDAFPMRGENSLVISVTIFSQSGVGDLEAVVHGSLGGGTWFMVSTDTISSGQGAYSISVSDVGYPQVRVGFRASSGSAAIVFGADIFRSCP